MPDDFASRMRAGVADIAESEPVIGLRRTLAAGGGRIIDAYNTARDYVTKLGTPASPTDIPLPKDRRRPQRRRPASRPTTNGRRTSR